MATHIEDDLTAEQWQVIVDLDFATLLQQIYTLLERFVPANQSDKELRDSVRSSLLSLKPIIDASGDDAAATAYALLNP